MGQAQADGDVYKSTYVCVYMPTYVCRYIYVYQELFIKKRHNLSIDGVYASQV